MKLSAWIKKMGLSQAETAKLADTDQAHVSNLATGKIRPSMATIEAFHRATKGEVTFSDWLFPVEVTVPAPLKKAKTKSRRK